MANEHLTVDQLNRVLFSSLNLTLAADQHNRRSVLRFQNPIMKRKSSNRRTVSSFVRLGFSSKFIFYF